MTNIDEITKRLRMEEKDGVCRFFVDGKFVLEDKSRRTFTSMWHDVVSCGLDYEDAGKTIDGFLDHFGYRKDGEEEQGRKSFEYCKRVYEAFAAAGVNIWEVYELVQE